MKIHALLRFTLPVFALVLGLMQLPSRIRAADLAPSPHLAPLAFLAGGSWRGALPPGPDGAPTEIEWRGEWSANGQALRFDSAWMIGEKKAPYTSGQYAWDPAQQRIVFWYTDAQGSLTQGSVTLKGATLVHAFSIVEGTGKSSEARARLTPRGPDEFTNEIYLQKDGAWVKVVEVRYLRQPVPGSGR